MSRLRYKLTEVTSVDYVAEFYYDFSDVKPEDYKDEYVISEEKLKIGWIEVWNGSGTAYSNIFVNKGVNIKDLKKIMRISHRLYILNKLGLLKHR